MRKLTVIFLAAFLCFNATENIVNADGKDKSTHYFIANEVKDAVLQQDIGQLMKYVSSSGTYFMDAHYTYKEIDALMQNDKSWLFKHLFAGRKSVKWYLEKSRNLKIKVYPREKNAVYVAYESSNNKPLNWVKCCFIEIDGKWYFDGIFSCE